MASAPPRPLIAGRYRLQGSLGRGGMGEVYLAWDERLQREVAVKRLRADISRDPRMQLRVESEARAAAAITHPNVISVYDSGIDRGRPFIVMERLEGTTLSDRLRSGPMSEAQSRSMGIQVLDGLHAAHRKGLVHRDVKPSNILSGPGDTWKVADFGIAKLVEADRTLTRTNELLGSPAYLAPERFDGSPATVGADLYAVGVVLYTALAGGRPFDESDPWALATQIREGRHPPLGARRADIDPALASAVERAMARDPGARFSSGREMRDAIDRAGTDAAPTQPDEADEQTEPIAQPEPTERLVLDAEPTFPDTHATVPAPAPVPAPAVPRRATRDRSRHDRSFATAVLVGALVLALVIGVAVFWIDRDGGSTPSPAGSSPAARAPETIPAPLQDALDKLDQAVAP
jgi:serine/threonine protein kinase